MGVIEFANSDFISLMSHLTFTISKSQQNHVVETSFWTFRFHLKSHGHIKHNRTHIINAVRSIVFVVAVQFQMETECPKESLDNVILL